MCSAERGSIEYNQYIQSSHSVLGRLFFGICGPLVESIYNSLEGELLLSITCASYLIRKTDRRRPLDLLFPPPAPPLPSTPASPPIFVSPSPLANAAVLPVVLTVVEVCG